MTNWIVRFNVSEQNQRYDSIQIMNKNVAYSAQQLGFKEINFVGYPNLNNNPRRRANILKSILGPIQPEDLVVIQFPLWTNLNFQEEFIDYIKNISSVKIIALIHDIPTWMFNDGTDSYDRDTDFWLRQLRKFDSLIVANETTVKRLQMDHVNVPMIPMHIWDYIYSGPIKEKNYLKKIFYVGGRGIVDIDYKASTPLFLYYKTVTVDVTMNPSVTWLGQEPSDEIISEIDGGFGLVVSDNLKEQSNMNFVHYTQFNNPTKLSLYIAAGIPVIVPDKTAHAKWVKEAGIGLVINNLNDVDDILSNISREDYQKMLVAIQPWQSAVRAGFFVKRALMAALRQVNLGFTDITI
jgi:glycosyltransferase involved in cell wall biosynthesis